MVLLGVSVALGLSRSAWNKAGRVAIVLTVIVVAAAMASDGALR
jgi:hypothetical protein